MGSGVPRNKNSGHTLKNRESCVNFCSKRFGTRFFILRNRFSFQFSEILLDFPFLAIQEPILTYRNMKEKYVWILQRVQKRSETNCLVGFRSFGTKSEGTGNQPPLIENTTATAYLVIDELMYAHKVKVQSSSWVNNVIKWCFKKSTISLILGFVDDSRLVGDFAGSSDQNGDSYILFHIEQE